MCSFVNSLLMTQLSLPSNPLYGHIQNGCLKHGTILIGNSKSEKLTHASYLSLASLGLPHGGEYSFLLVSPLY